MTDYDLSKLNFLVVDDNANMRFLVRTILRWLGADNCREAADGVAAIQELENAAADIVICDWDMLPVNGLEFTRMVRKSAEGPARFVPIIMLTGFTEVQRVVEARDSGIHEFLAKPVSVKRLYARLRSIIENPRPFIRATPYFGPDRRRKEDPGYAGPERRVSPAWAVN